MFIEIVYDQPDVKSPLFCREYLSAKSREFGWFVSDHCTLGFYIEKRVILNRLVFTAETECRSNTDPRLEREFLNSVVELIRSEMRHVHQIYQPNTTALFNSYPDGAEVCGFGTYLLNLEEEISSLLSSLHGKHRNVIRKAERDGLTVEFGREYCNDFYKIYKDTMVRQARPYLPMSYFKGLEALSDEQLIFGIVKHNDLIQGGVVIVYAEGQAGYYLHGGSSQYHHTGALNLLHWEVIKTLKDRNVLKYNFVGARLAPIKGSKQEGMQRFKSRFGGNLESGFLWKINLDVNRVKLFYLLAQIRSLVLYGKKYGGDIIDEESNSNV